MMITTKNKISCFGLNFNRKSTYQKGKVSIMTANLDGETNLKTQSAPNETRLFTQPHLLNNLRAQV